MHSCVSYGLVVDLEALETKKYKEQGDRVQRTDDLEMVEYLPCKQTLKRTELFQFVGDGEYKQGRKVLENSDISNNVKRRN